MFDAVNRAMGEPLGIVQERKALIAQQETLRKAERVLTRDPEITSLIGTTDDDLLFELRREKAEGGKGMSAEALAEKFLKPQADPEEKVSIVASHPAHPVPAPAPAPSHVPLQASPAAPGKGPMAQPGKSPSPDLKNQGPAKPASTAPAGGKPGLFGK